MQYVILMYGILSSTSVEIHFLNVFSQGLILWFSYSLTLSVRQFLSLLNRHARSPESSRPIILL